MCLVRVLSTFFQRHVGRCERVTLTREQEQLMQSVYVHILLLWEVVVLEIAKCLALGFRISDRDHRHEEYLPG